MLQGSHFCVQPSSYFLPEGRRAFSLQKGRKEGYGDREIERRKGNTVKPPLSEQPGSGGCP